MLCGSSRSKSRCNRLGGWGRAGVPGESPSSSTSDSSASGACQSTSDGVRRMLSGTSTAPRRMSAWTPTTKPGPFGARRPTRSPARMPRSRSAAAARVDSPVELGERPARRVGDERQARQASSARAGAASRDASRPAISYEASPATTRPRTAAEQQVQLAGALERLVERPTRRAADERPATPPAAGSAAAARTTGRPCRLSAQAEHHQVGDRHTQRVLEARSAAAEAHRQRHLADPSVGVDVAQVVDDQDGRHQAADRNRRPTRSSGVISRRCR